VRRVETFPSAGRKEVERDLISFRKEGRASGGSRGRGEKIRLLSILSERGREPPVTLGTKAVSGERKTSGTEATKNLRKPQTERQSHQKGKIRKGRNLRPPDLN